MDSSIGSRGKTREEEENFHPQNGYIDAEEEVGYEEEEEDEEEDCTYEGKGEGEGEGIDDSDSVSFVTLDEEVLYKILIPY